jgi:hypothetical protein
MLIFLELLQDQHVTRKAKLKYNQSRNLSRGKTKSNGDVGVSRKPWP